ncbi:MAG: sn-glycerol-3-phosphate ABC transporter ATP-binding protein UgpC, partial [Planctomycetota bacterium]
DRVSKTYPGGVQAVRELTLSIRDRELVVLVGPSGCGKTTSLRMIAGLEEPDTGVISIEGRPVNGVPPKDRNIAMVFQNYALYPHMTVFRNMAFGLELRKTPREEIRRRVEATAEALGLTNLLDRRPRALSGGQRQRVALGRAMVREPKVFLLDEPLSNLDAKLRVEMRAELKRLHQRLSATLVYVTHDQAEAMTLGDRIAVMNGGRLEQYADPLTVYRRPANRFVATFLGTPPMNILPGRVVSENGGWRFAGDGISVRIPPAAEAAARAGGLADLGVRPENIRISPAGSVPSPDTAGTARVDVVEPLGDALLVHLAAGPNRLVAKVPPTLPLSANTPVSIAFDTDLLHLFDPADGTRLTGMNDD